MKIHYSLSFDDMAGAMADNLRRRASKAPLTDVEREVFIEGFRAGLTVAWQTFLNGVTQTPAERTATFELLAGAVASWDLPIEMHVRAMNDSEATKQ